MAGRQLNVSITPHFSKMIRQKVKSGRYANASEVVREALRRLEQDDLRSEYMPLEDPDDMVPQVRQAIDEIERGDYIEVKGEQELRRLFDGIIERGKARLAKRRQSARR